MIDRAEIERIILVEVLGFKKPERAGSHCSGLAANAAEKIIAALDTSPKRTHNQMGSEDSTR